MSFDDIVKQCSCLCNLIAQECENAKDYNIKQFKDVKNTITIINDVINIRRSLQTSVIKLDNINALLRKNLNDKELMYTKKLNMEEETYITGVIKIEHEISSKNSIPLSSPFLVNICSKSKDEEHKTDLEFIVVPKRSKKSLHNGTKKLSTVDLGFENTICLQTYKNKEDIPELSYGIIQNGTLNADASCDTHYKYIVIFRISKKSYTSCEIGRVSPEDRNIRTVFCNSMPFCKRGNNCGYYHSPLYYPNTDHIKFFFKTPLCPKDPTFGDGPTFKKQKSTLTFMDVGTLASYCATQLLLIRLLCQYNSI